MAFEYRVAQNLDTAWSNFEPDLPLHATSQEDHPFYVARPDNVIGRLKRQLTASYQKAPKYFLSGHRGCGKSTELYRLAVDSDILDKYWPIHFSIREHADLNDIDFKDVLLALGGQLFTQYTERGHKKVDKQLLKELEAWRGKLEEEIVTLKAGYMSGELGGELTSPFAKLSSRIKYEPKTRHEIRRVLDPGLSQLLELINRIITDITSKEGKPPLILIDDLDKIPDLTRARQIFIDQQDHLLKPICPVVYTISSSLFYDAKFPTVRIDPIFLPNIALHEPNHRERRNGEGFHILKMFILRRMDSSLIEDAALEQVAAMSGGVFRELTRLVRSSIDFALDKGRAVITEADVQKAAVEMRNTYWRVLTQKQLEVLHAIWNGDDKHDPEIMAPLLQTLAALEYNGDGTWFDVHPVLQELLFE